MPLASLRGRLLQFGVALAAALVLCAVSRPADAKKRKIKVATLAPEGSSWSKVMTEWAADLKRESGGTLRFKLYETGVMGDESDVIRKMKIGQVHAGLFTGNGLGQGLPALRVLETPMLFGDEATAEVDYVWQKMGPRFRKDFEARGYVILGDLAETGFARIMSSRPLKTRKDLATAKLWLWEGDRFAEAELTGMGLEKLTPLAVPDVLTSLQTGLIEAVYSPPYAAIAMQWHTRTKYFTRNSFIYALGGMMLTKKMWDKLDPAQQAALEKTAKTYTKKLREVTRRENQRSVEALKKAGLEELDLDPAALSELRAEASKVRRSMAPEFFPLDLLEEVEGHLKDFRSKQ